jgi:hypothetical protein
MGGFGDVLQNPAKYLAFLLLGSPATRIAPDPYLLSLRQFLHDVLW